MLCHVCSAYIVQICAQKLKRVFASRQFGSRMLSQQERRSQERKLLVLKILDPDFRQVFRPNFRPLCTVFRPVCPVVTIYSSWQSLAVASIQLLVIYCSFLDTFN